MKKISRFLSVMCAAAISASLLAVTPSAAGSWKTSYAELLTKELKSSDKKSEGGKAFSVYDLNSDGTPELIISPGLGDYTCGVNCRIYTYSNGKAVLAGELGSIGTLDFYPSSGILSGYLPEGELREYKFTTLSGSSLKTVKTYSETYNSSNYSLDYKIDGKKVSSDKYYEKLSDLCGNDLVTLGRSYKLNKDSISYAIKGVSDYKKAYSKFLTGGYEDKTFGVTDNGSAYFYTYDITGDKTPELFVRTGSRTMIFTFADKRIQYFGENDTHIYSYDANPKYETYITPDKKELMFSASVKKYKSSSYTFCSLKKGYIENGLSLSYDVSPVTDELYYSCSDGEISAAEYKKLLKENKKSSFKCISSDQRKLTSANVKKAFG
ncbi:MAG: hypothetical protein II773_04485 [Oscillospiraceae bacterium]|nr:hypothetical protein [Oscillospiraceae bacterium]